MLLLKQQSHMELERVQLLILKIQGQKVDFVEQI